MYEIRDSIKNVKKYKDGFFMLFGVFDFTCFGYLHNRYVLLVCFIK